MDLISLIITLVVVGVVLWLVNNYVPMDPAIKKVLNIAVVVLVVLWLLLSVLGVANLGSVRVG